MMTYRVQLTLAAIVALLELSLGFVVGPAAHIGKYRQSTLLYAEEAEKAEKVLAGPLVSGEELELILTDLELPLVIDAYATWCGPCLIMAPEFENAAKELKGKVQFVKLDTDQDETMATRLNIMGLPTLLFLDKYEPKEGDENQEAKAVLKGRIEGALRKENIMDLCEHYFFGGPAPELF